jgi:AbiV family abortive infection protein
MCRKTLEAICAEHAIRARNLAGALTEMKERGLIEGRLFEWADTLRIAGNQAAHNVAANVTGEDARDLLEFTEALLEYVSLFVIALNGSRSGAEQHRHSKLHMQGDSEPSIRQTIQKGRQQIYWNALRLVRDARELFRFQRHPLACFCAMTAIEEAGKLFLLMVAQGDPLAGLGFEPPDPSRINTKKLQKFLHNHLGFQSAFSALYVNSAADRRQGRHPGSGIHRTSGIPLLARSGKWMDIRNACLYANLDVEQRQIGSPESAVTAKHAYYFTCMAYEILAEQVEAGLGSLSEGQDIRVSSAQREECLAELEAFMKEWADRVDVDSLDFLANPEPYRLLAERREAQTK